jgi:CheY-like chemotaxis protein
LFAAAEERWAARNDPFLRKNIAQSFGFTCHERTKRHCEEGVLCPTWQSVSTKRIHEIRMNIYDPAQEDGKIDLPGHIRSDGGRKNGEVHMQKPVILAIDDDPQVARAVERDLRERYRRDYRILSATSGAEALSVVGKLKQRNTPLALFLADQRMPEMTGTEFLAEAVRFYPDARKVLLTAYADTQAAITSINTLGLDYYLMKPWDPPEQNLYPVLDDLLSDWAATVVLPYEGIRVAGTLWSPRSHEVKDFLARNQIPYQWLDIEVDAQARALVETTSQERLLPVVYFEDGSFLTAPTIRELAERIGLYTPASQPFYDLLIIGGGPAGLAAAVYGASEGLRTLMIEKEATGGQAGTSSRIENYLGFPKGLSGPIWRGALPSRPSGWGRRSSPEMRSLKFASKIITSM